MSSTSTTRHLGYMDWLVGGHGDTGTARSSSAGGSSCRRETANDHRRQRDAGHLSPARALSDPSLEVRPTPVAAPAARRPRPGASARPPAAPARMCCLPGLAVDPDPAPVGGRDLVADGQAQPAPARLSRAGTMDTGGRSVESQRLRLKRNPGPRVRDPHARLALLAPARGHDLPPGRRELDRVLDRIRERQMQPLRISPRRTRLAAEDQDPHPLAADRAPVAAAPRSPAAQSGRPPCARAQVGPRRRAPG